MTGLIALAIALASVTAYLLAGWKIAVRFVPLFWEKARHAWYSDDSIRGSVKGQVFCMVLFWPFVLTIGTISHSLGMVIDAGDPKALEERIRERDQRIAELERELRLP